MLTCKQDDHDDANYEVHQLQDVRNDLEHDTEQLCTNITALQAQLEQVQNLHPPLGNNSGHELEVLHAKNAELHLQLE